MKTLVIEKQKNKYRKYRQVAPDEAHYKVMTEFGLSVREAQVYLRLLQGKTRKEIRAELCIGASAASYAISMVCYKTKFKIKREGKI